MKKGNTYFCSLKKKIQPYCSAFGGKLRKNKPSFILPSCFFILLFLHLITALSGKVIDKTDKNIKT